MITVVTAAKAVRDDSDSKSIERQEGKAAKSKV